MSRTYICRCGEKKEPCYQCVHHTCNMLRGQLAEAREEAKNAISILNLWYNLGWSEEYRKGIEELTKLKEQG